MKCPCGHDSYGQCGEPAADDYLCDCGHVSGEHSYHHGCGHSVTIRENDEPREYVCACHKQPGEIIGIDGVRAGAAVGR